MVEVPITFSGGSTAIRGSLAAAMVQRLERQVDAGCDGAAAIAALVVHHVEGGGRAEIDDDQRRLVALAGGHRIDDAVGADLVRDCSG